MDSMETMQVLVPEEWRREIADAATLLEVLSLGLEEYRIRRALTLYQHEAGSLGYVADVVGISKRVLLEEARRRGFLPLVEDTFVEEDLAQ